jgi:hypothetical protein
MKNKLKLASLNITSFVTDTAAVNAGTLKGGTEITPVKVVLVTENCTGVYPTFPLIACAGTQTNGYGCPCEQLEDTTTAVNTGALTRVSPC